MKIHTKDKLLKKKPYCIIITNVETEEHRNQNTQRTLQPLEKKCTKKMYGEIVWRNCMEKNNFLH